MQRRDLENVKERSHMNPMGNKNPPVSSPPQSLGSIRHIYVSKGRGFRTKNYPRRIYPGGAPSELHFAHYIISSD